MNNPEWRFPSNDDGEIKGINDSGVSTFKGEPLQSLAREICQNSLDAAINGKAYVEFSLFSIRQNEIPGYERLKDAFIRCYEFSNIKESREFFSNAIKESENQTCNVLRISDHMTTGLTGSREKMNTNWTNLIKSSGVSDKKGSAGGSFGIGKFAPFACSEYSCVFYSTYDEKEESAYQGVARLASFNEDDESITQGIGYYGNERNTPVYEQLLLEPGYHRGLDDYGTDIYIIAYRFSNYDWQTELVVTILDNFIDAIWSGKLSVKIDNIEINSKTLNKLIKEEYLSEVSKKHIDKFYELLTSEKTIWIKKDNFYNYGRIELGILLGGTDMPRKISMIRKNGMRIMNKNLRGQIQFIGTCKLIGDKLNARLRAMENPEHTKWEPNRLTEPRKGRMLIKTIDDFIKEEINKLSNNGMDLAVDAVGVGTYIPDEDDSTKNSGNKESLDDSIVEIEKQVQKISVNKNNDYRDGKTSTGFHSTPGTKTTGLVHTSGKVKQKDSNNRKPATRKPNGDESGEKTRPIQLKKLSPMCIDYKNGLYVFILNSEIDVDKAVIEIELSTEEDNYPAIIKEAVMIPSNTLKIENNRIIEVPLKKDIDIRIKVELDYHDYCPLEVNCYEIEE